VVDALFKVLLFGLPSFAYVHIQHRQGQSRARGLADVGVRPSRPVDYLLAVGVVVVTGALGALVAMLVPDAALADPRTASVLRGANASGAIVALAVGLSALAEELLFRGYLQMVLDRQFSFVAANTIQAAAFALAHVVLLAISPSLWPLLLVHFAGGWLLGWLRHRSGSIVPGWAAHVVLGLTAMAAYGA
jgi:membrane protease YdiL (CAAX protease family)